MENEVSANDESESTSPEERASAVQEYARRCAAGRLFVCVFGGALDRPEHTEDLDIGVFVGDAVLGAEARIAAAIARWRAQHPECDHLRVDRSNLAARPTFRGVDQIPYQVIEVQVPVVEWGQKVDVLVAEGPPNGQPLVWAPRKGGSVASHIRHAAQWAPDAPAWGKCPSPAKMAAEGDQVPVLVAILKVPGWLDRALGELEVLSAAAWALRLRAAYENLAQRASPEELSAIEAALKPALADVASRLRALAEQIGA